MCQYRPLEPQHGDAELEAHFPSLAVEVGRQQQIPGVGPIVGPAPPGGAKAATCRWRR